MQQHLGWFAVKRLLSNANRPRYLIASEKNVMFASGKTSSAIVRYIYTQTSTSEVAKHAVVVKNFKKNQHLHRMFQKPNIYVIHIKFVIKHLNALTNILTL